MRLQRMLGSIALVFCVVVVGALSPLTAAAWYVHDTGEAGWWGQSSALPDPDHWEPMDGVVPTGTPSVAPLWPEGYEYSPFYTGVSLTGSYGGMYVKAVLHLSNPHPTDEAHITVELWRYADQSTPTEFLGTTWWNLDPGTSPVGLIFGWRLDPDIADFNGELLVFKIIYDDPQTNGARIHWDGQGRWTSMSVYPEPQGLNPHVRAYIDFSPPDYVHSVTSEPYSVVDAYLVLDCFGHSEADDGGMTVICFAVDITPGTSLATSFTNLLPGGISIGEWETGISLAGADCAPPDGSVPENNGVVLVGKISMVYSGTPGDIVIADHPIFPRWLVGCVSGDENRFRVLSNGGIGQPPSVPGDAGAEDCFESSSTIENCSWGAIKAMYR